MAQRRPNRRGVVLLMVISLLVLFVLLAATFAIVAGQYRSAAVVTAQSHHREDSYRRELEMAFRRLLRDDSQRHVMMGHSLLEDLYGRDGFFGAVTTPSIQAGGEFVYFEFIQQGGGSPISDIPGYYGGRVLTFLTGAARGISVRVVSSGDIPATMSAPQKFWLRVERPESDSQSFPFPSANDRFLVNGAPFNGTGSGYVATTDSMGNRIHNIDLMHPVAGALNVAVAPNHSAYVSPSMSLADIYRGGADESWDAADFQNMFMALVPEAGADPSEIIPSFYRPELVAYWFQNYFVKNIFEPAGVTSLNDQVTLFLMPFGPNFLPGDADETSAPWSSLSLTARQQIVAMKRSIIMRPLREDNPDFTGSQPNSITISQAAVSSNGLDRWDVDSDGDGTTDAIWMDIGLPVMTMPDGRRFKRLAAIQCRDLNGRIDINAVGNLVHTNPTFTSPVPQSMSSTPIVPSQPASQMPRGFGVGPAEISIGHLVGNYQQLLESRYGRDMVPGQSGATGFLETISRLKTVGIPDDFVNGPYLYGAPPDIRGQAAVAVDWLGTPVHFYAGNSNELLDQPYESRPSLPSPDDAPFTVAELERVLRRFDRDQRALPNRLGQIDGALLGTYGHHVTTVSSSLPVLPGLPKPVLRDGVFQARGAGNTTILDMYRQRVSSPNIMKQVVPWELLRGQPLDINRLFGNGFDDAIAGGSRNGVVDEPAEEAEPTAYAWQNSPASQFSNAAFNYTNDVEWSSLSATPPAAGKFSLSRHLFARHLYCLMLAVSDATPGDVAVTAQWAINVVDFRDRDSIMTAFEYDTNPFNGWDVDGDPGTNAGERDREIVWGTEFPEMLLKESLAFHQRNVKDTAHDNNTQKKRFTGNNPTDRTVDQFGVPQGSLFFELYNPRNFAANPSVTPNESRAAYPAELYGLRNGMYVLDIGRLAPTRTIDMNSGISHPVWRAVITQTRGSSIQQHADGLAPAEVISSMQITPNSRSQFPPERIIWFSPRDPAGTPEANLVFYERTTQVSQAPSTTSQGFSTLGLPPGEFMVGLPRADTRLGHLKMGMDGDADTPELSPHALRRLPKNMAPMQPEDYTFAVDGGAYAGTYPPANAQLPRTFICAANPPTGFSSPIGMNISEPRPENGMYYPAPRSGVYYVDLKMPFSPAGAANENWTYDIPLDDPGNQLGIAGPLTADASFQRTGTLQNFRTILLERLANPLSPWNPLPDDDPGHHDPSFPVNPYIAIDWGTVDLTVFSGAEDSTDRVGPAGEPVDPTDPDPYGGPVFFSGRERGVSAGASTTGDTNHWSPKVEGLRASARIASANDHYFDRQLNHTLGYLNSSYGTRLSTPPTYVGGPADNPFPWLTWNDRPFMNPLELLLVPQSNPTRLLNDITIGRLTGPMASNNPYANVIDDFKHLPNFFYFAPFPPPPPSSPPNPNSSRHPYRLFDYVETPSLFVGAEKWYHPNNVASGLGGEMFRPPYNRMSRFRDQGRMNINTIADEHEFEGAVSAFADGARNSDPSWNVAALWNQVQLSRQGYPAGRNQNGEYPTRFANPFRSANSADMMPNIGDPMNVATYPPMRRPGVEVTLLRSDSPTGSRRPLFGYESTAKYDDTNRHAYFRYRGMNRLSNLFTTQSNVYAVWITLGYFEVQAAPGGATAANPDGFQIGQEIGADTGEIVRHRAFYIVDRSIPVAFEPGQDHNVDRCVLLRRIIE